MAKTLKGRTVWIGCTTTNGTTPDPQNDDLDLAGFEALDWTQIKKCGAIGESGATTETPSYDSLDTVVIEKSKGTSDAGNPTLECSFVAADNGQIALRAASLPTESNAFAFKWADDDGVIYYNRGISSGPTHPNGRNGSFRLDMFKLGLNQLEVLDT